MEETVTQHAFEMVYQGGAVFIRFDIIHKEQVKLKGISFDGYGYLSFENGEKINPMQKEDSKRLVEMVRAESFNSDEGLCMLKKYFKENIEVLWGDVFEEYGLV